ncbi:receptor-type tyrosine-protein phosphatase kappa-like [Asterias rubens]|uniref:receptor-type tyrosine-protein phosphatase kappa-like n=1 Tax=Asterias rubens TaxID=7604 RepID=UPI0014559D53|nr:receptor-type tyrosine-protein phosphatase kappa-like [Asterias rubens]
MEVLDTCSRVVYYFLLTVIVYSSSYSGVFAVDDFTCVTKPRVPLDAEDTFIAGFFVNLTGSLSIRRTQYTYTTGIANTDDRRLPTDSNLDPTALHGDVSVSVLQMPASGGVSRIGVYGCQATVNRQSTYNIGTVVMSSTAHFVPNAISQTVNSGEAVRLTVTATTGQQLTRWRKDSSIPIASSNDRLYYDINGASTDAGTYEVHVPGVRSAGRQALMRLLVRGCRQQDRWGASCNEICPVCLNGGVCDNVGGLCICPPGFSGDICEIVLGPNRFGKDGSLYCDSGLLPNTTSCEGLLFCLPDPFGCICGAGYKGIDCNTECDDGTFGANCAQMCNCSGQAICDKTTGRCPGDCASSYKGINCQDACVAGYGGLNCATPCEVPADVTLFRDVAPSNSQALIHLAWKFVSNLCAVERYQIGYELTNQDQCAEVTSSRVEVTSDLYADSLIISSGLQPFSSYTVYIKAWNEIGAGPETSISVTSGESVPTGEPENVMLSTGQTNGLSFTWDPIPCGSRHGSIEYHYKLQQKDVNSSREGRVAPESVTVASGLLPCTDYMFKVAGVTSTGRGPYSTSVEARTTVQAPNSVEGLNLSPSANEIQVSWQASTGTAINPCTASSYNVTYELLKFDQCDSKNNPVTVIASQVDTTTASISGLEPYSSYRVYVVATNTAGDSSVVGDTVITAEIAPSGPPRDIQLTVISNTTLSSSWHQPECGSRHGVITQYSYTLTTADGAVIRRNTTTDRSLELTDLIPFTQYTLSVAAMTSFKSGPDAVIMNRTDEGIPPALSSIYFPSTFSDHITVGWNHPSPPHGIILSYEIRYWKTESETSSSAETLRIEDDLQDDPQTKEITNLESNMEYSFQVRAETRIGFGEWSNEETAETVPGTPSKPQLLMVSSVTETSISLSWSQPMQPNGNMLVYKIEHRVVSKPYDSSFTFDPAGLFETQNVSDLSDLSGTVMNLEPSTEYELQVYGINEAEITGDKASIRHFTAFATDLPPPEKPSIIADESTSTSIAIRLVATTTSKYITAYQIGVQMTSAVSRRSAPAFGHYRDNPSAYIAAELDDGLPEIFVVGDNKEYGSYWNPPLQEGAVYNIYVGAVSRINETEANVVWNDDPFPVEVDGVYGATNGAVIAIGIVVPLLLVIVLILLLGVFWRRRKQHSEKENGFKMSSSPYVNPSVEGTSNDEVEASVSVNMKTIEIEEPPKKPVYIPSKPVKMEEPPKKPAYIPSKPVQMEKPPKKPAYIPSKPVKIKEEPKQPVYTPSKPVPMSGLADYIKKNKSSRSGFQHDYESLPGEPLYPWTVAEKEDNKTKNRYVNIIAYDHSRVVLDCIDGDPSSDYINACYIHGYQQDSKYIACQGPNKASLTDIWRMVWQEQVGKIVMLTNLVENGKKKCEKYWPDGIETYAGINVANISETSDTNYIIRKFHVLKSSEPDGMPREVMQYHYITWPDMKPPESSPLLQFIGRVHASETTQQGPIVVHCSAGVGRTGTYITVDSMLEQGQAEGQVDVLTFVRAMREQRFRMVQTLDQYKFIFDALLESCLSENTAIPIAKLHQDYTRLKKKDPKTGSSGLKDQFLMLEIFTVTPNGDRCLGGKMPDNIDKNRFQENLPVDKCRPYLMTSGEEGSTNYINATFLDGYKNKNAYLATQAPLPNTVGDIWRMVYDYKSSCIVMLNSMDNDPSVAQYWPDEGSVSFEPLTVTSEGIHFKNDSVIVRHFSIYNSSRKNDKSRKVCHIQFLQWPTRKDVPNSPSSLLKVLETVNLWTKDNPDGPITVQCIDGLGRSGTLCALMTILESIRETQTLDVFQAVKKLRATRAGMVQSLAQYQFCYGVAQEYLDSNCIYENLK